MRSDANYIFGRHSGFVFRTSGTPHILCFHGYSITRCRASSNLREQKCTNNKNICPASAESISPCLPYTRDRFLFRSASWGLKRKIACLPYLHREQLVCPVFSRRISSATSCFAIMGGISILRVRRAVSQSWTETSKNVREFACPGGITSW